jgi:hypothetical protein
MSMAEDRVANVKAIAARIAKQAEGLSVREFLDACALAGGTMIRSIYRGAGVGMAAQRYEDAFRRAVNKTGA